MWWRDGLARRGGSGRRKRRYPAPHVLSVRLYLGDVASYLLLAGGELLHTFPHGGEIMRHRLELPQLKRRLAERGGRGRFRRRRRNGFDLRRWCLRLGRLNGRWARLRDGGLGAGWRVHCWQRQQPAQLRGRVRDHLLGRAAVGLPSQGGRDTTRRGADRLALDSAAWNPLATPCYRTSTRLGPHTGHCGVTKARRAGQ